MNMLHLRAFLTISKHLNLSHAAETLGMAQPALSRMMTKLQDEIGVQLYFRKGRGIALTDAGRALQHRADDIINRVDDAVGLIADMRAGVAGHVRIGTGPAFISQVAEAIGTQNAKGRNVKYTIREGTTHEFIDWIKAREVDFALLGWIRPGQEEARLDTTLNWKRLIVDDLVVVAREGHPLHERGLIDLHDLADFDWVFPRTNLNFHHGLQLRFEREGLRRPHGRILTSSLFATMAILRRTDLVTILARKSLSSGDTNGIRAFDMPGLDLHREAYLVTMRGVQLPQPVIDLIDDIKQSL